MSTITAVTLPTRSGLDLDVRPATEADAGILLEFFDRVSDEDRRFRFFAAAEHVSEAQLAPMVHADHFRTESWLGFNTATGELIASGLLACDGPLDTGEIAISVANAYKGQGVGWAMLDFLANQAKERGCRRAIAIESRDNHAAIELEREKGFVPEPFDGDPTMVVLSKSFR
ncbi:GNAT family N-acetyltransferase [Novosphingobium sp. BW1]|uniref:GNAT family N-acetyltransferase n=1 Tax=Novosphingobium sp. BW1 TaxID=2592621 RepID=UPI0011DE6269|nr:GNAT family N-acetyltransferase [Novosphingobium sp. BW1]TYC90837.1 GNAT family N-acetyltransferase [Novosphingobium sp. BW1]